MRFYFDKQFLARCIFMQMYSRSKSRFLVQIQSDKSKHIHTLSHILNHKKSLFNHLHDKINFSSANSSSTHNSTSSVIWFMIQCRIFSIEAFFFLFLSPFPFYRPSSDGILMILIIAFLIHHFNFIFFCGGRVSSKQIDEWRCIKF